MKLVIVESPAKCQKIQGFLGPGWRVIASMGHIRALEEDLDAVGLDRDFDAKFHFQKEKAKAISQLKEAAQNAEQVYLAADDDREGEAIAYSVALLLKLSTTTTPRAVFHEITEKAVKQAIANPRRIDMNRVNAQQARAILDMMVGFTISPLLWKHIAAALSAGRCQTPALRLVVEKEREIRSFKSTGSWRVKGRWGDFDFQLVEDLEDEESAKNYLENIHNELDGTIQSNITRPFTESAPRPLITSTYQQEASALYRVNPKLAMQIAQRLYEAGHITYMRTDKAVLSEEAVEAGQAWVQEAFGKEYCGAVQTAEKKSKKAEEGPKAQEAHEAIRPTHFENRELPTTEDWSAVDRKMYQLIWNRAVQSVMASAKGEIRTILLRADGDPCEFDWQTTLRRILFPGWRRLGRTAKLDDEEEEDDAKEAQWSQADALSEGTKLVWQNLEANPYQTKASPRYTEATLVRELEKKGIGRPSTFAMLLNSIQDKEYVKKENIAATKVQKTRYTIQPNQWPPTAISFEQSLGGEKDKLVPTPLGERVIQFCLDKFNDLFDYGFTAQMETRLDKIAEGNEFWKQVLRDTWASYKDRYEVLKKSGSVADTRQKVFSEGVKAVQTKKGPVLLKEQGEAKDQTIFYGWPEGVTWDTITEERVKAFLRAKEVEAAQNSLGELDGKPIERKQGPFGHYVQWGDVKLSIQGSETREQIEAALKEKGSGVLHVLGPFEFRKGPYGVYMFKKDLKQKKFVGVPATLDPKNLTEAEAIKIYQAGLQQKAKAAQYRKQGDGPARGGAGGARRGRGRGRA